MSDPFDLDRFLDAQRNVHEAALLEIRRGQKRSHWMWFAFPQIAGLGFSATAERYAIRSLDEARAYLAHPVLGARLVELVKALEDLPVMSAIDVFGSVDAMKLRSSLTLFIEAGGPPVLTAALDRWFSGEKDQATLRILSRMDDSSSG